MSAAARHDVTVVRLCAPPYCWTSLGQQSPGVCQSERAVAQLPDAAQVPGVENLNDSVNVQSGTPLAWNGAMARRATHRLFALSNVALLLALGLQVAGCSDKDKDDSGAASGGGANTDDATGGRSSGTDQPQQDPGGTPVDGDDGTDFVSYADSDRSGGRNAAADATAGSGSEESQGNLTVDDDAATGSASAARAITEADIIKVEGDILYALSQYSGLSIIDLSDPADLRIVGRYRSTATPFEMYIEGGTAYIMYNDYSHREWDEDAEYYVWATSSRMEAIDVSTPASPRVLGYQDLPGSISDSRKVGDIVYVVTYQYSYCWECDAVANTRISSFDVSDPGEFNPVDEERFDSENESWGTRHVSVSEARMYVSGYTWSTDGSPETGSIQVVDISDPDGQIEPGAIVEIQGQIDNRWQMDEYDGVLRVISQPSSWTTNTVPVLETFAIASSTELTPLARLDMIIPENESLQSVRFDGERAFAVTFEQTDPLFTFDVTDPENPQQLGELEIPGFLYFMEPRGDRLYALGFDSSVNDGSLHVSIFDVSDLTAPTMLDRVNFGGDWGWFAEDQDRIHKAFNLALDDELILMPFSGSTYDEEDCYYNWESGIQLIDAQGDDLTLRGVAPQVGEARRALLHEGVLFGVSDNAIQAFDISDRDNPTRIDRLDVARNVSQVRAMGDELLRFGSDWWTDETTLDLVALAEAESTESNNLLDLSPLTGVRSEECSQDDGRYSYRYSYFTGQVFVNGDYAFVPRELYESGYSNSGDDWYDRQTMRLSIVDLSGSEGPRIVGDLALEPTGYSESRQQSSYYAGFIQTDGALLVGRRDGYYYYNATTGERSDVSFSYDVIDLTAGPDASVVSRIEVPDSMATGGWGYGPYGCSIDMEWGWYSYDSGVTAVSGNIVASQHEESVEGDPSRVRYFLDRIDVTDPAAPVLLEPINIPGKVIHYEHDRGLLVTVEDYPETIEVADYTECYDHGNAQWDVDQEALEANDYDWEKTPGTCRLWHRRLNSLVLDGDVARRVSLLELDADESGELTRATGQVAVSNSRVFYQTYNPVDYRDGKVEALGYGSDGRLSKLGGVALTADRWYGMTARDNRAFVSDYGVLQVITSPNGEEPSSAKYELRSYSCGASALEVVGDQVFCAGDQYGVQRIDLE